MTYERKAPRPIGGLYRPVFPNVKFIRFPFNGPPLSTTPDLMDRPHKKLSTNPLRQRRFLWLEPGFLFVVLLYCISGTLFIWWISYLEQKIAAIILTILWIIMLPVIVFLARRMIYDTYWVDNRTLRQTKQGLAEHRLAVRKEFIQTELDILSRGEKCRVLDIWHLNDRLAGRHLFFASAEAVWIDPAARELQIRVLLNEAPTAPVNPKKPNDFFIDLALFLTMVSSDLYLRMLKRFFDNMVLEIYALREDEQHIDRPFPFLSMLFTPQQIARLPAIQPATVRDLASLGDVRFADGAEIEPHRNIEGPTSHGK